MLSPSLRNAYRELIKARTGVVIPPRKDFLLEARIKKLLNWVGSDDPVAVLQRIQQGDSTLLASFYKAVTTNHTYFFREREHFHYLLHNFQMRGINTPKIWVAASSTGEEVWSIAMTLNEAGYPRSLILASDIDILNLRALKAGVYPEGRLHQTSPDLVRKYFTKVQGRGNDPWFRIKDELRPMVKARRLNLLDSFRLEDQVDAIFCRNVLMYFSNETQVAAVHRLVENLAPGGLFFMGQSETVAGIERMLEPVALAVFRKRSWT